VTIGGKTQRKGARTYSAIGTGFGRERLSVDLAQPLLAGNPVQPL